MEQERIDTVQLSEQVKQLLESKNFREIRTLLDQLPAQDCAQVLENLPEKDMPPVFRLLSKENAAETFVEMPTDKQQLLISVFSDAELKAVFDELFVYDTLDVIE